MSHRSHQNDYGLASSTPNTSVPGTPGSGSQDYALEEVGELHCYCSSHSVFSCMVWSCFVVIG